MVREAHASTLRSSVTLFARLTGVALLGVVVYLGVGAAVEPFSTELATWGAPVAAVLVAGLLVVMLARSRTPRPTHVMGVAFALALLGGAAWLESMRETAAYPADSFAGFMPSLLGYAALSVAFLAAILAGYLALRQRGQR
jgi:hypothetical protein